jgi:hypothetical protein
MTSYQRALKIILLFGIFVLLTACQTTGSTFRIEARFDGEFCVVTSPAELPPGDYEATLIDTTDLEAELMFLYLEDCYTIQDALAGQSEPGKWYPKPSWLHYDDRLTWTAEDSNGQRIETTTWRLDRVGEHNIYCGVIGPPPMLWIEAALQIVEAPSD